jgi:thymidylate synthase (methanogen type)
MEITTSSVLDAWKRSLKYIVDNGEDFKDLDNRICREVLNLIVVVENPGLDSEKPIDMMQGFEWIYPSKEELASIILNKEESAVYEYSYGPRIFSFQNNKDQINEFIIPLLQKDPSSRRAVISLFNPSTDSNVLSKNIPSLMFLSFKIRNGRLNLTCFIRSNDFFIGWPGNIYQIYVLQKYVADKLGIVTGALTTISCSAHVFQDNLEMVEKIIGK